MLSKFLVLTLLVMSSFVVNAQSSAGKVKTVTLLSAVTTTGVSAAVQPLGVERTMQATGTTSSGTGAATVLVEVSNDCVNYFTHDTLSLTLGTTATSDTYETDTAYKCIRANVSAISGTGAAVTVTFGVQQ